MIVDREAKLAAEEFGFSTDQEVASLCAYAPVYRLLKNNRSWVLKRTGYPHSNGSSLRSWLRAISEFGISVVSPAESFDPNPRAIRSSEREWVVYPYIEGSPYRGEPDQIAAAGSLLGQIHRAGADFGKELMVKAHLPIHGDSWQEEEVAKARKLVSESAPDSAAKFERILNERIHDHVQVAQLLRGETLPLAACSWDFKAVNLVFGADAKPVLVDPDHGGRIPRLYELACSALLFHCDSPGAPGRMFSADEWKLFLKGYAEHVKISETERRVWQDVLTAAWVDEGLWLIGNWPEGWNTPHDRRFLMDLATSSLGEFVVEA